jgi:signal peptidase I
MSVIVVVLALSTVAALTARGLRRIVWMTRVTSWSMSPTLRPGQLVMTRRVRRAGRLRRGDIVVAESAELGRRIVKRVAALPGDRVHIDGHRLAVNGTAAHGPYTTSPGGPAADFVVPQGAVLLLGDNRSASSDSRSWAQPYLPFDSISGRLFRDRFNE